MRRVDMIMGMPVIIDIPQAEGLTVFDELFEYLRSIDKKFSTYLIDSEVSRFNRGELLDTELSKDFCYVYKQCVNYKKITDGYFDAQFNTSFDPSGFVKAWAMSQVSVIIKKYGYATYLINIAGDMIAAGDKKTWNIAIQDPWQKKRTLGVVSLRHQAIATSGSYQRGDHIINPFTKLADTDLLSVSIIGRKMIRADVFATACTAMGSLKALEFLAKHPAYSAYLIKKDGTRIVINGFKLVKMQTAQ